MKNKVTFREKKVLLVILEPDICADRVALVLLNVLY